MPPVQGTWSPLFDSPPTPSVSSYPNIWNANDLIASRLRVKFAWLHRSPAHTTSHLSRTLGNFPCKNHRQISIVLRNLHQVPLDTEVGQLRQYVVNFLSEERLEADVILQHHDVFVTVRQHLIFNISSVTDVRLRERMSHYLLPYNVMTEEATNLAHRHRPTQKEIKRLHEPLKAEQSANWVR